MTETATQTYPDANAVLMGGGGAPAVKLDQQGVEVGGSIVTKPQVRQETEFGTQKPKFFPSGDPILGLLVDVQTNQRDASVDDDDGVRRFYIEGKRLKDAVREAVRASGAPGLEVGGQLWVAFIGHGQPASAGISSPKLYQARYVPAATAALQPQQQPPVQQPTYQAPPPVQQQHQQAPVQQQAAPPQQQLGSPYVPPPNAPTPEQVAAVRAAGLNPAAVFPGYNGG